MTGTQLVQCHVYVDGVRYEDGSLAPDDDTQPFILSGLSIHWGRETTVDQPDTSTCVFEIEDHSDDVTRRNIGLGRQVRVIAVGQAFPDPDRSTFRDVNAPASQAWVTGAKVVDPAPLGGTRFMADSTIAVPVRRYTVDFAPAPASPLPDAWDDIPMTTPGQVWRINVRVNVPPGVEARMRPIVYAQPGESGVPNGDDAPTVIYGSDSGPVDVSMDFHPSLANRWVGVRFTIYPTGTAWNEWDPAMDWASVDPDLTWNDLGAFDVLGADALSPAEGTESSVLAFEGRISDMELAYDEGFDGTLLRVTAVDFTADLANLRVGDEPWPAERLEDRVNRIREASGDPVGSILIDPDLTEYRVSYRDVDSQPFIELIRGLGSSVDGVVWPATHIATGAYLTIRDPAYRDSIYRLTAGGEPGLVRDYQWSGGTQPQSVSAFEVVGSDIARTNWARDPGYGYGTGGASAEPSDGVTLERIATGHNSPGSLRATTTEPLAEYTINGVMADVAVEESDYWLFSTFIMGTAEAYPRVTWTDDKGVTHHEEGDPTYLSNSAWYRVLMPWHAPQNAVSVRFDVVARGRAFTGSWIVVDDVLAERNQQYTPGLGTPFDGDTEDVSGTLVTVQLDATKGLEIQACDVLREPVTWTQDVGDVSTRVSVTWKSQDLNEEGAVAVNEHTETVVFAPNEAMYGRRGMSLSSEVTTALDAREIGTRVLARNSVASWRITGLTVDAATLTTTDTVSTQMLLTLLDGTSRNGLLLRLAGMPSWSPAETGDQFPVYLEGGEYTYQDGEWQLALNVSDARRQGRSATWADLSPDWRWVDFDPTLSWVDLYGVSV